MRSNGVIVNTWNTPPTILAAKVTKSGELSKTWYCLNKSFVIAKEVNCEEEPAKALSIVPFTPLHRPRTLQTKQIVSIL